MDNVCLENVNELDDDIFHDALDCYPDGPDSKDITLCFGGDAGREVYCEDPFALSLEDVPGDDPRWNVCSSRIGVVKLRS